MKYVLFALLVGCSGTHAPGDAGAPADAELCATGPEACAWFAEMAGRYEHLGGCEATCPAGLDAVCAEAIARANNCERLIESASTCACGAP